MNSIKERMMEIIRSQPDDANYEDILRELALARMIERGVEDSRKDKIISNQDMERRIRTWSQ